ncbi:MAG: NAD(P)-dependent oxidoreductase [archaeon]|nr:NAD(P)-dependent oxidoreductase [archaeon]
MAELSGLPSEVLEEMAKVLEKVEAGAGKVLIEEGVPQDRVFVVLEGWVERLKNGVSLDRVNAPRVCGLLHAFRKDPTFATLRGGPGAEVYVLASAALQQLVAKHGALALHLLEEMAGRLRTQTKWQRERLEKRGSGVRVMVYDAKSYDKESFEKLLPEINARAPPGKELELVWLPQRLTSETASAALGAHAVCIFVNDVCSQAAVSTLAKQGVRLVVLRCAGYDGVDLQACLAYGLPVVRVPAYSPEAVAEHACALMMTLARKIHQAALRTREANFSLSGLTGLDIHGKTVGVIGTGKIGRCFVNIARGFGALVLVTDVYADHAWAASLGISYVTPEEIFRTADVISIHCPLLPSTRHMINAASIATMKPGVMLLNTSRGAIIDTQALLDGLASGQIGSAGLDVYEHERPYFFQDHSSTVITDSMLTRLSNMKNVILTGHQAFLTHNALSQIATVSLNNLAEYFWEERPQPLTNQVLDEWNKAHPSKL